VIHSYTVVNPRQITVHMDEGPTKSSNNLKLRFHGEDGEVGELMLIDYDKDRSSNLFDAIRTALHLQEMRDEEKARAA
jgi:hypothetical protein